MRKLSEMQSESKIQRVIERFPEKITFFTTKSVFDQIFQRYFQKMRILPPTVSNKSKITNFYLLPKEQKSYHSSETPTL